MFRGEAALPAGLRVYAIGDVHGRADCLAEILERIDADLAGNPVERKRIVMLGDYTDRGPASREVVEILSQKAGEADFICLRGNHDDWFLRFLTDPDESDGFLNWGGIQTLESVRRRPDRLDQEQCRTGTRAGEARSGHAQALPFAAALLARGRRLFLLPRRGSSRHCAAVPGPARPDMDQGRIPCPQGQLRQGHRPRPHAAAAGRFPAESHKHRHAGIRHRCADRVGAGRHATATNPDRTRFDGPCHAEIAC